MADKIRNFFRRKKDEAKFKLGVTGPGRKLNENPLNSKDNKQQQQHKSSYNPPPPRKELSEEVRNAAAAALARIEKKQGTKEFNTSLAAIKAQVKRELEAEQKLKEQREKAENISATPTAAKSNEFNKNLACQGVYFRCPLISSELLSKDEWKKKIKEFLYEQLKEEEGLTACLIIQNCNTKEKAEACIETLSKYLENLINNPTEEKYHKIRMENRHFVDKVRYVEGSLEFLHAAGFRESKIDDSDYLVWSSSNLPDGTDLNMLLDALHNAEQIKLELDRNIQVLLPSQARRVELPPDFYRLSTEEIKREQARRAEVLEDSQILKTKAMREKEELRTINKYRFALIRVKFPNGIYLQGTFNVYEKLSSVYEFVQSCLQDESIEFSLTVPPRHKFTDEDLDKSLYDLRLIPNTVLIFICENTPSSCENTFLKEELLMLIQNI